MCSYQYTDNRSDVLVFKYEYYHILDMSCYLKVGQRYGKAEARLDPAMIRGKDGVLTTTPRRIGPVVLELYFGDMNCCYTKRRRRSLLILSPFPFRLR